MGDWNITNASSFGNYIYTVSKINTPDWRFKLYTSDGQLVQGKESSHDNEKLGIKCAQEECNIRQNNDGFMDGSLRWQRELSLSHGSLNFTIKEEDSKYILYQKFLDSQGRIASERMIMAASEKKYLKKYLKSILLDTAKKTGFWCSESKAFEKSLQEHHQSITGSST